MEGDTLHSFCQFSHRIVNHRERQGINMLNTDLYNMASAMEVGYDTTFEMNEFGEPRIRGEIETIKNLLMFILLSKPSQYPSLPTIGLDLEDRLYNFYDELDENDLIEDICSQCEALRKYFNNGTIGIRKYKYHNKPSLLIIVYGNETFPQGYHVNYADSTDKYLIGLTFNEMNQLIYDSRSV